MQRRSSVDKLCAAACSGPGHRRQLRSGGEGPSRAHVDEISADALVRTQHALAPVAQDRPARAERVEAGGGRAADRALQAARRQRGETWHDAHLEEHAHDARLAREGRRRHARGADIGSAKSVPSGTAACAHRDAVQCVHRRSREVNAVLGITRALDQQVGAARLLLAFGTN
eukprot:6174267-Pleurochrysis_carterae.AAC.2